MTFVEWNTFTSEFVLMFCPENEVTTALMWLEFERYFQGRHNVEAYIDEFKDLIDMSGSTDPITIVLKFCRGLNAMAQDRITKAGTDRPRDNGWFKAAQWLDLSHLANEASHYASQCLAAMSTTPSFMPSTSTCTPFSFTQPAAQTTLTPVFMHAPSRQFHTSLPPGIPMDINYTKKLTSLPQPCYQCGRPGHISRDCPNQFDIQ
jgi:hypothetical protein